LRPSSLLLMAVYLSAACSSATTPAKSTSTRNSPRNSRSATESASSSSRDEQMEMRVARLDLKLLEKEALVEDLQTRLDDAQAEVVRAMAKLRSAASRAEAASGMAEAEVALQSLKSSAGSQASETAQVSQLLRRSADEFDKQNYGGALYLADQAKTAATAARARLASGARNLRQGETQFAVPVRLKVASKGNVREGPGTSFPIVFAVDGGNQLTGFSYTDDWVRVTDDAGRNGWIFRPLVTKP